MLNEKIEFESYMKDPESENPRILPKIFTGEYKTKNCELNGLEQILVSIARGYIFTYYTKDNITTDDGRHYKTEIIEETRIILQQWLGFEEVNADSDNIKNWNTLYPDAKDGWLKKYWHHWYEKKRPKKKDLDLNTIWKNELVEKKGKNLQGYDYQENVSTLNAVIASAFRQGPLRERCLIFKKDTAKNTKEGFAYLYTVKEEAKKPSKPTEEKLLKNIAAYLILREYHPEGQKYCLLYRHRLLNWYGIDDSKNAQDTWYFKQCLWGDKKVPIMDAHSKDRGWNFIKFSINESFLKHFDFRIIDKSEIQRIDQEKYWILNDTGAGKKSWKILNNTPGKNNRKKCLGAGDIK